MKIKMSYISYIPYLITAMLLVGCDKEVSISPEADPIPTNRIVIDSDPQGAEIFINNSNTGKFTPDSIINVDDGFYQIKLRYHPYLDMYDSLEISGNNRAFVSKSFYDDFRNFSSITCTSNPAGCLISINDSSTGQLTPYTLGPLWPGTYKITLSYPEFRDETKHIFVRGGEAKSVSFSPQDTSQCVDYNDSNSDFPAFHTDCVAVDKNNIIWIGNNPGGLVKYDGVTFTNYNPGNSLLPQSIVQSISVDENNTKWIGTRVGLITIDDNENWTLYNTDNSDLPSNFITAIDHDSNGDAWVVMSHPQQFRYLSKFDGTTWENHQQPPNTFVVSIAIDKDDVVWTGLNFGIKNFLNGEFILPVNAYSIPGIVWSHPVESIVAGEDGRLWIGVGGNIDTPGDLVIFDGANYSVFPLPQRYISHLHLAENGNVWISSLGKYPVDNIPHGTTILIKMDQELNVTEYSINSTQIASDLLMQSASDAFGNLWIASRDKGVIKFKGANL